MNEVTLMKNEDVDKGKNTRTLVDIVCKWYTGAVIGSALGYSYGNSTTACIGFVIGIMTGWILQKYFNK